MSDQAWAHLDSIFFTLMVALVAIVWLVKKK